MFDECLDGILKTRRFLLLSFVHLPVEVEVGDLERFFDGVDLSVVVEEGGAASVRWPVIVGNLGHDFITGRQGVDVLTLPQSSIGHTDGV